MPPCNSHTFSQQPFKMQDILNGRPNNFFVYFLFQRWNIFLDSDFDVVNVDHAVFKLLSTCTDRQRRLEFMKQYEDWKKPVAENGLGSKTAAAIMISGDFFGYIAEACELIETSTGGF